MARKSHKVDNRSDAQKAASAREGAIRREVYFSQPGATAAGFRGGRKVVTTDRILMEPPKGATSKRVDDIVVRGNRRRFNLQFDHRAHALFEIGKNRDPKLGHVWCNFE